MEGLQRSRKMGGVPWNAVFRVTLTLQLLEGKAKVSQQSNSPPPQKQMEKKEEKREDMKGGGESCQGTWGAGERVQGKF